MDDAPLPKLYDPSAVEEAIYRMWLDSGAFDADPDERPRERRYVIMMPLPNVTGALHMGHAMDNVMQDLLIRWHRMRGDNTLWMPGTDHAGIATQAVVEKRLKELEGRTRHDLGRDKLVERIWRWKDEYQERIVRQQQRMGCSCDWRRQRFTMDEVCARAVRHAFFRMFEDGLVYRGKRMVNWDVALQTSVSDDEVEHKTVAGHFWHLSYPVIDPAPGEPATVVVATTRPETMLADTAVAVHPDPEGALAERREKLEARLATAPEKEKAELRAQLEDLEARRRELLPRLLTLRAMARAGRRVTLPLMERPIPLILDEWAKPELGSGCVKITPAHDPNDYEVWQRHREEIDLVNILEQDGTLNREAGAYAGLDRFEARRRVVADLEAAGRLERVEEREIEVGHSDRSKTPVEPYLSDQWFVAMGDVDGGVEMGRGTSQSHRSPGLVQAAIDAVRDGRVTIHPERYAKTYLAWLEEKRDWPISRQLWWGHRIPVWTRAAPFGEQDLAALASLFEHPGAALRLQLLERDESFVLTAPEAASSAPGGAPAADEECALHVCLLEDDAELAGRLAELGFEQDPCVLDTWFSSALWPMSTLGWPDPETAPIDPGQPSLAATGGHDDCLDYYYPGSCLVTGRDIITLWVARMVLAGLYLRGRVPFSDVFIHANIMDGKGERMSKSKGNGIDPVDIIDGYGTDAMRYVLSDMQTGSQDIRLPVTAVCPRCGHHNDLGDTAHGETEHGPNIFTYLCGRGLDGRQRPDSCGEEFDVLGTMPHLPAARLTSERFDAGRAFCTKLWNSARFAFINLSLNLGQSDAGDTSQDPDLATLPIEDRFILDALGTTIAQVEGELEAYNPSAAINAAREFFWGALCDWYLELIKARLKDGGDTAALARRVLAFCLDQTLRLLHPFVPFITEHLWQKLGEIAPRRRLGPGELDLRPSPQLATAAWPRPRAVLEAPATRALFAELQEITRAVREVRNSTGTPWSRRLRVTLSPPPERREELARHAEVVGRLTAADLEVTPGAGRAPGSAVKVVGEVEIFVHDVIDDAAERERLERERDKLDRLIAGGEKKLANPNFVERAPAEVVAGERERLEQYRAARETLLQGLAELAPS